MRMSDWSSEVCSSDLGNRRAQPSCQPPGDLRHGKAGGERHDLEGRDPARHERIGIGDLGHLVGGPAREDDAADARSEEHTSELQSLMRLSYAVSGMKKKKSIA